MSNHENFNSAYRMIRIDQVIELTGLSRSTIFEKMNSKSRYYDATFPKSVALSTRATGWVLQEIEQWLAYRIAQSRGQ
ncbi:MAG: AlpA family transcriptional regulator [Moraxellaceae bacterium]|nr:MAG: AlpA family transcriptional regulator [Moraxellaceae bacterium]